MKKKKIKNINRHGEILGTPPELYKYRNTKNDIDHGNVEQKENINNITNNSKKKSMFNQVNHKYETYSKNNSQTDVSNIENIYGSRENLVDSNEIDACENIYQSVHFSTENLEELYDNEDIDDKHNINFISPYDLSNCDTKNTSYDSNIKKSPNPKNGFHSDQTKIGYNVNNINEQNKNKVDEAQNNEYRDYMLNENYRIDKAFMPPDENFLMQNINFRTNANFGADETYRSNDGFIANETYIPNDNHETENVHINDSRYKEQQSFETNSKINDNKSINYDYQNMNYGEDGYSNEKKDRNNHVKYPRNDYNEQSYDLTYTHDPSYGKENYPEGGLEQEKNHYRSDDNLKNYLNNFQDKTAYKENIFLDEMTNHDYLPRDYDKNYQNAEFHNLRIKGQYQEFDETDQYTPYNHYAKPFVEYEYDHEQPVNTERREFKKDEQPLYVNVKQFHAIRKRKMRRDHLDTLMKQQNSGYLHESRHRHAMNRMRAPSGRFLTKEETAKLKNRRKDNNDQRK